MPTSHALKKLIRARMADTGENYTTARRKLLENREDAKKAGAVDPSWSSPKVFILFDGRALTEGTDDAAAMDTAWSEAEARREGKTTWKDHDAVWFEYDLVEPTGGGKREAVNQKMRADIPPGKGG